VYWVLNLLLQYVSGHILGFMGNSKRYRTILCEDNRSVREIFSFILQERGHEVFSYEDAGDCPLSSCSECKCNHMEFCSDLIISDVSMPRVNGLKFIEDLKIKGCKIKSIALVSGYWTEKDISKAKELDCAVFYKPVAPEELFEWIDICEKDIDPQRVLFNKLS
jgi:CheY-like chemotaxis protein